MIQVQKQENTVFLLEGRMDSILLVTRAANLCSTLAFSDWMRPTSGTATCISRPTRLIGGRRVSESLDCWVSGSHPVYFLLSMSSLLIARHWSISLILL